MKKALKAVLCTLGLLLCAVIVFFAVLTVAEYRPAEVETLTAAQRSQDALPVSEPLTVVAWNIGYGALGDNADFFMDGGKMVNTADKARVERNLQGMAGALEELQPDLLLLQEVDIGSTRSHGVNEREWFEHCLPGFSSAFAYNFNALFVPYPLPPIGHVESGLVTLSRYQIGEAQRISLPCPFSWPVRMANLKRCLLVTRLPAGDSGRELVLVNLHLEAYDDGEGKAAQTKQLADFLQAEAEKGSYVIAGGDFNQLFSSVDASAYPVYENRWLPGRIDVSAFNTSLTPIMDASVPTCRSLDQPYAGADLSSFQYYVIDGFIVSSNVQVEAAETLDLGFVCTDHNPVRLRVRLTGEE